MNSDTLWSVLSILFVFFYFIFHLRSIFLAFMGILIVLFSFPLTVVIVKGLCQVYYISQLHMLMIFIVLGIAADDIFVFIDAWRQSEKIPEIKDDKLRRMAYTFRRSSRAMLVTSSTTAAAFLANVFSPIMPIKSFGIFSGVIVPANFLLVVCIFPSATIIYEDYFLPCCQFQINFCPSFESETVVEEFDQEDVEVEQPVGRN